MQPQIPPHPELTLDSLVERHIFKLKASNQASIFDECGVRTCCGNMAGQHDGPAPSVDIKSYSKVTKTQQFQVSHSGPLQSLHLAHFIHL